MLIIDDTTLQDNAGDLEIVNPIGRREITHVIHDIDGTHSLIRDWPPVMSRVLYQIIIEGLGQDYDSEENVKRINMLVGTGKLPETDKFCIESAGLSALTQMEWAIRRGIEDGSIKINGNSLDREASNMNSEIIRQIWDGRERFRFNESQQFKNFLTEHSPRLFKLYEAVLCRNCRDKNLAAARKDPEKWQVAGSMQLLKKLHSKKVKNYFVTGAVIQRDENGQIEGGMYEEVMALGFEIGAGKMIEALIGSQWNKKIPKDEVTRKLCKDLDIEAENLLIIGDGRAEIEIGVEIGAATMSRLPIQACRMREIHRQLGTNYIIPDYEVPALYKLLTNIT